MSAVVPPDDKSTFKIFLDIAISKKSENIGDTKLLSEYKKVVDASAIVSKTDKKGIITYVNEAFCKISGYSQEELLGKPHNIVRHPNMPSSAFEDLWNTIKAKKIWKGIVENLKKDGSSYFVKATIVPILDENNEIVEYIGLREDITELIEQEKEIKRLTAQNLKSAVSTAMSLKISDILKHIPIPLVCIDEGDNIVEYNSEFEALFDLESRDKFLKRLVKHQLNLHEIFDFSKYQECLLDWKEQLLNFDDEIFEVQAKFDQKKSFSLKIKNSENNTYIVAFVNDRG